MNKYTKALPAKWKLKGEWLTDEEGYRRYALDDSGKVDALKIATTLENYGYDDHAKIWRNQDDRDLLLESMRSIVKLLDGSQPMDIPGALMVARYAVTQAEAK